MRERERERRSSTNVNSQKGKVTWTDHIVTQLQMLPNILITTSLSGCNKFQEGTIPQKIGRATSIKSLTFRPKG